MTGARSADLIGDAPAPDGPGAPLAAAERPRTWSERLGRLDPGADRDRLVVSGLVVAALILRVPNLGRAFWVDEGISVGIASHPLSQIPGLLRLDGSPPLWYVLLHFWIELFGSSVDVTHLLPLGISLLVIPVAYRCVRALFDRPAAIAAAALAATNPFLAWYGTETRMYTLVALLSLVAVTSTVLALRPTQRRRHTATAVVCFALLLYTHDWGAYLLAVTGLIVIYRAVRLGDRRLVVGSLVAGACVAIAYLPWLPTFLFQARTTAAPWAVSPEIGDIFADSSSTIGGTIGFIVVPVIVITVWLTRRERETTRRATSGLIATIGIGTLVTGWLASQIEPSWTIRYLAVVLAPLLLATAGMMTSTVRSRLTLGLVCLVLALASAVGSLLPNANARYAKSNVAAIASAVGPKLRPGDLVVTAQTEQLAVLAYYLPAGLSYASPTGRVDDPRVVDWQNIVARLRRAAVCKTILPLLQALPIGARVLEVNPLRKIGSSGSAWSKASNTALLAVDALLAGQRGLQPGPSYSEGTVPKPYSAVEGQLFTKVSSAISCR